jgi:S-layer protein
VVRSVNDSSGINLSASTGVSTVTVSNSTGKAEVSGVGAIANFAVSNQIQDVTFNDGTATTLSLTATNVGNSSTQTSIDFDDNAFTTVNLTVSNSNIELASTTAGDDNLKTLSIAATGANVIELTAGATSLETLTITGAGSVDLAAGPTTLGGLKTLSAGTASGAIKVIVDDTATSLATGSGDDEVTYTAAAAATANINLGGGNDKLVLQAAPTAGATIAGGDGTDTFAIKASDWEALAGYNAANLAKISGFEVLAITDALVDTKTYDLSKLSGLKDLVAANGVATDGTATVSNLASGQSVTLGGDLSNNNGTLVIAVKNAGTGTADVLNVVTNAANGSNVGQVTANKVETINIEAKDTVTGTGVSTNTLKIDADKAATVNVKGAGNLTLTFTNASTDLTTVDGSDATGQLNITAIKNSGENLVIKGGHAADILTSAGQNDKLFGNEGNDVLKATGTIALVELDGGTGIDTYDVSTASSKTAASVVRITNFEKGETIKFAANPDASFLGTKFEMTGAAGLSDYVGQALAAADAYATDLKGGAATHGIAWFQFGNNTYIAQDVDGDAAFSAGDIVVEIVGLVDLSASSFNDNTNGTLLHI